MNIRFVIDATKACASAVINVAQSMRSAANTIDELAAILNAYAIIERRKATYKRWYRNGGG